MQELEFVPDDSDAASLVLRDPGSDRLYWIPVTGALRDHITVACELTDEADADAVRGAGEDTTGGGAGDAGAATVGNTGTTADAVAADAAVAEAAPAPTLPVAAVTRPAEEPRPRVRLRPREIQKRLRHGATVAQLAAETGESESRLLPYAHPIEMERHRIAELARQAYPVLPDGPAEHTLWEVLATYFGANGEDVRAAAWDAAMDSSDAWIVSVTWTRGNRQGAAEFVAEFRWVPAAHPGSGPATVEPANSVAADLVNPRFNRPVRTVSAPVPGQAPSAGADPEDTRETRDAHHAPSGTDAADPRDAGHPDENRSGVAPAVDLFGDPTPDNRPHPAKRRRNSTTPHWEDVLLGVRTSPRKKK